MALKRLITPIPVLGMDVSKPGEFITARATKRSVNMQIRRSLIDKRPGTAALGTGLGQRVQYMVELDNGASTWFVRIGTSKFEELNKTTLAWTNRAHAAMTGDTEEQISVAFPLLSGVRVLTYTNGLDPVRKYIGGVNDVVLGGSPPLCKYLIYYSGYLLLLNIIVGGNVYPWRFDWSDSGDIETYSGGNSGSLNLLEDSGDITGGGNYGQFFTIHKENAIYVGAQTNTSAVFRVERKETGAGTIAHKTILSLPTGEQLFLARDGLRIFNGITAPPIEAPINDELRDLLNPLMAYKSWGVIVRELDEAWIGVPLGSDEEPTTIYKFNYKTRQVNRDNRPNITAIGFYRNTKGQITYDDLPSTYNAWRGAYDSIALGSLNPIYAFGFSDGSTTYQDTGSSDNGTAISGEWDGKDFTSDDYGLEYDLLMRWLEIRLWAKGSGFVRVYYTLDGGISYLLAGSLTLPSEFPDDYSPLVLYIDKVSTKFGIRLIHDEDEKSFTLKNYAVVAVEREEAGI